MEREPCPFCRVRIVPIKAGPFKQCPLCGGYWAEGGGGSSSYRPSEGSGGGAVAVVG
jgi:hypothetical protein